MDYKSIIHLFLIIFVRLTSADTVCSGFDIKNEKDLYLLRDCTTIVGHISLSNFRISDGLSIASALEEVTDYLLVYRVDGLETLEYIFPNLTIIRGHHQLFDKYSLVVYENRNTRNLGLKSLLKIRSGSILIESNPVLCFADTVNWVYLMENHSLQQFSLKDNQDPNECALCLKNVTSLETEYLQTSCWNVKNFQRKKAIPHLNDCPEKCGLHGCSSDRKCCSPLCLTGCLAENCLICKDFKNQQGTCIESCNVPYYTLAAECITERECRKKGLIPHAGSCTNSCPKSYQKAVVNGLVQCNLLCVGNFTIRSKNDLDDVRDCVSIRGSLHIELNDDKSKIIAELENALGGIKEIAGSLKITKSPQLVSLGFFKKLDTIRGDQLIDNEIAFYVVNNYHLEEIWSPNHKVAILKGRIYFHLNPRLCYAKILELVPSIRNYDELHVRDASRNSNGERVICGNNVRSLYPKVEDFNATAVRIKLDPLPSSDKEVVLGYIYYYKEAPVKNVTMFDGRHGCGRDNWQMDMTLNRNIRHVIFNLKPYTQYAFFVKTFTMVDYHMKIDWYSTIHYFRTSAMKPGPVDKIYSIALSANTINVHWWPPKDPNGVIDKYILRYESMQNHTNSSQINGYAAYTKGKNCHCDIQDDDRINRGPPPEDKNYYNRNQVTVDEAIPNLIFISADTIRRLEEERRIEDNSRRKRETVTSPKENIIQATGNESKTIMSADEQEKIDREKATELMFKKHLEDIERKSLLQQDTGIADFPILSPKYICSITNPSKKYQLNHNCSEEERYEGIEILGKTHSYTLDNLEADMIYRIFIRACVEGLKIACGPERSIEAETVSKSKF